MSDEPNCCRKPDVEPTASRRARAGLDLCPDTRALFLGAVYFDHHSGWFDKQVYAPYAHGRRTGILSTQIRRRRVGLCMGRPVYETVCGLCHGNDGLGKPNQAPPLAGSEWVAKDAASLARVPLAGLNGAIQVERPRVEPFHGADGRRIVRR